MIFRISLAAASLAAGAAVAGPRSIADCEQIQAADAYNRCLASFGPAVGARAAHPALSYAPAEPGPSVSHGTKRSGAWIDHRRHGRTRMIFSPGRRGD